MSTVEGVQYRGGKIYVCHSASPNESELLIKKEKTACHFLLDLGFRQKMQNYTFLSFSVFSKVT